jgi:mRNA interferase MazF
VVVQGDALNRSRLRTVVCVPLTSNPKWPEVPGNVRLASSATGLTTDSVANATQIVALGKTDLTDRSGKLSRRYVKVILQGIYLVLGR